MKNAAKGFDINYESLLTADEKAFNKALITAQRASWENFGKKIRFYAPSFAYYKTEHYCSSPTAFPSISVTGSSCALKCRHCGGIVLNTMYPATTPHQLLTLCKELKDQGAVGVLISGGCQPDGSVPLNRFVNAIAQIKKEFGLIIVVHTGVISEESAQELRDAGVDAALIDIIGSDETIREIYQLDAKVADYDRSLANLSNAGVPLVPHVLVGLHYGKLRGELQALKMIMKYNPSAVIIISFIPIYGTEMENIQPPAPMDVGRVVLAARLMMPKTPLVLGCMRPKGRHKNETDMLAVKAGVNAIAFPAEVAVAFTERMGYQVTYSSLCCSQIYVDIKQGF
jgi:uncharacterized radical SAM superfamily protein